VFHVIFFFVPLNQGFEGASVGFVVNGKVDNLHYSSNKYVRQGPPKNGLREYRIKDLGPYGRI
jgi:hypothetical protein